MLPSILALLVLCNARSGCLEKPTPWSYMATVALSSSGKGDVGTDEEIKPNTMYSEKAQARRRTVKREIDEVSTH